MLTPAAARLPSAPNFPWAGPTEKEPLDSEATRRAFEALTGEVNAFAAEQAKRAGGKAAAAKTPDDVAYGGHFRLAPRTARPRPRRAGSKE